MTKRFLAVLMAVLMTATVFAVPAFAAGEYANDSDMEGVAYTLGEETWQINFDAAGDKSAVSAIEITNKGNFAASKTTAALYKMNMPDIPDGKVLGSAEFRVSSYYSTGKPMKYAYKFPGDEYDMAELTIGDAQKYINSSSLGTGEYYLTSCIEDAAYSSGKTYRSRYNVTDYIKECLREDREYFWIAVTHSYTNTAYPHDSTTDYWRPKLFYTYEDAPVLDAESSIPAEGDTDVYPITTASVTFTNDIASAVAYVNGEQIADDEITISGKTVSVTRDFGKNTAVKLDITATDVSSQACSHTLNFTTAANYAFYDDSDMKDVPYTLADGSWILDYTPDAIDITVKAATVMDSSAENYNVGSKVKAAVYKLALPEIPDGKEIATAEFRMSSYYSSAKAMLYSYKMAGDDWNMDTITIADAQKLIDGNNLGTGENYLANCMEDASYANATDYRNRYEVTEYIKECIANGQSYVWIAVTRHNTIKAYRHDVKDKEAKLYYTLQEAGLLSIKDASIENGATDVYPIGTASVTFSNPIAEAVVTINGQAADAEDVTIENNKVLVDYDLGLGCENTIAISVTDANGKTLDYTTTFTTASKYAFYNDSDMEGIAYTTGEGTWVMNYDADVEDTTALSATVPTETDFNIIKYQDAVVYKMKLPEVPDGKRVAMAEFRSSAWMNKQRFIPYSYKMPGDDWNMNTLTIADAQNIINEHNIGYGANYLVNCSSDDSYYDGVAINRCKYDVTDYVNECIRNGQKYVWIALTQIYTIKPFMHDQEGYLGTKLFYTLEDAPEEELIIEQAKIVDVASEKSYYSSLDVKPSEGKNIKASVYVKNTTASDKDLYIAIAQYNGNKLEAVTLKPYKLTSGNTGATVYSDAIAIDGDAYTLKAFVWNKNLSDAADSKNMLLKALPEAPEEE
ncbi:MAG: hypothetical protein J6B23_00745 [Clostridia bacterium]|nr:hypothetical protein [Clostridia bacterium]